MKTFKQKLIDGDYTALGPEGKKLIEKHRKFSARHYEIMPFPVEKAFGFWLQDVDENKAVDYLAGYSSILDHNNPRIRSSLYNYMKKDYSDLISGVLTSPSYIELCESLCEFTGYDKFLAKSDGGSATDTAVKGMLRHAYEKGIENPEIITWKDYFHGRTINFSAAADFDKDQQANLPKKLGKNLVKVPFFDIEQLEDKINKNTIGIFIEIHQGEGGPKFSKKEDYIGLMKVAKKHGLLVGADEIQTGFGRCGYNMAYEEYSQEDPELKPDFITIGKAIGAGAIPVSGILGTNEFMEIYTSGTEGSTYGGSPISSIVGLNALKLIKDEDINNKSIELGNYISEQLESNGIVSENRGSLIRIELSGVESAKPACYEMLLGDVNPRVFMKYGHTEYSFDIPIAFTRMAPVIIPMHKDLKFVKETIEETIAPTLKEAIRQETS